MLPWRCDGLPSLFGGFMSFQNLVKANNVTCCIQLIFSKPSFVNSNGLALDPQWRHMWSHNGEATASHLVEKVGGFFSGTFKFDRALTQFLEFLASPIVKLGGSLCHFWTSIMRRCCHENFIIHIRGKSGHVSCCPCQLLQEAVNTCLAWHAVRQGLRLSSRAATKLVKLLNTCVDLRFTQQHRSAGVLLLTKICWTTLPTDCFALTSLPPWLLASATEKQEQKTPVERWHAPERYAFQSPHVCQRFWPSCHW